LKPDITYLLKRFNPGGDWYIAVDFYCGALVFDPVYAKTLTNAEAHCLIDKIRHFHQDELIRALKLGFISYKTYALQVAKQIFHVLQWHYDLHEHLEADEDEDRIERNHRYCKSKGFLMLSVLVNVNVQNN
jgi:hypothetical protein